MYSTFISISSADISTTTQYAKDLFSDLFPLIAVFVGVSLVGLILSIILKR